MLRVIYGFLEFLYRRCLGWVRRRACLDTTLEQQAASLLLRVDVCFRCFVW